MRRVLGLALAMVLLAPAVSAAQDDEMRTGVFAVPWSDEPVETLLPSLGKVIGFHDEDYCRWMASNLGVEATEDSLQRCGASLSEQQSAWIPETMLPSVIEATREAVPSSAGVDIQRLQDRVTSLQSKVDAYEKAERQRQRAKRERERKAKVARAKAARRRRRNTIAFDGTYRVGRGVRPGLYRSSGGRGCYWARLRNFRGSGANSIIDNNFSPGRAQQVVRILRSDAGFETTNCGTWRRTGR